MGHFGIANDGGRGECDSSAVALNAAMDETVSSNTWMPASGFATRHWSQSGAVLSGGIVTSARLASPLSVRPEGGRGVGRFPDAPSDA